MTSDIKVGDVVPWSMCGTIPWGTLLAYRKGWTVVRAGNGGFLWVQRDGEWDYHPRLWPFGGLMEEGCRWDTVEGSATIVALGLTGRESAKDLQRLAEVFEVREAWCGLQRGNLLNLAEAMYYDAQADDEEDEFFERLRAVGWRSGMSAEDADRLLAEVTR